LEFVDRARYRKLNDETSERNLDIDDIIIPEGGFSNEGVNGAALISNYYKHQNFTHICTAVGSGTTLRGLVKGSDPSQQVIGYSAAKDPHLEKKLRSFIPVSSTNFQIIHDFH